MGTLSNVLSDGTSYTEITVAAAVRVYFDTNNRLNIGGIRTYTFTLSVSQDITAAQGASVTQGDNTGTLTTALTGATTTVTITVAPGVTLVDNIDLVLDITTTTTTTTTTIPNADISAPPTLSASNGGTQVIGTDIIKVIDLHATGTTTCQTNGKFDEVTCTGNPCVENRKVAFSDQSNMVGGTGQSKVVTCNQGYKILGTASDATASVICQPNGAFEVVECIPVPCTAGLNIPFSNYKAIATHTFTVAEQLISENQNVIVTQNSNIGYLTTSVGATGSTTTTITITTNISEVSFVTDQNLVVGTTTIDKDDIFSVVNNGVETSSQLTGVTLNEVEVMCDSGYHESLVSASDTPVSRQINYAELYNLKAKHDNSLLTMILNNVTLTLSTGEKKVCMMDTPTPREQQSWGIWIQCSNDNHIITWTRSRSSIMEVRDNSDEVYKERKSTMWYNGGRWWSSLTPDAQEINVCVKRFPTFFLPTETNTACQRCVIKENSWCATHEWDSYCMAQCKTLCKTECSPDYSEQFMENIQFGYRTQNNYIQIVDITAWITEMTPTTAPVQSGIVKCYPDSTFKDVICVKNDACFENNIVPNSDYQSGSGLVGNKGDSIVVTCNLGYSTNKPPVTVNIPWNQPYAIADQDRKIDPDDVLQFTWNSNWNDFISFKAHSVYKFPNVNDFNNCDFSRATLVGGLKDGIAEDVMPNSAVWYGCPHSNRCEMGMKIKLTPKTQKQGESFVQSITAECGSNGNKWVIGTKDVGMLCEASSCVDEHGIEGDFVNNSNYKRESGNRLIGKFGDPTINVICDTGYYMCQSPQIENDACGQNSVTNAQATCSNNGRYTGVKCLGKTCTTNLNIPGTAYETTDLSGVVGDVVHVTCLTADGPLPYHPDSSTTQGKDIKCKSNLYWETFDCVRDQNCMNTDGLGSAYLEYTSDVASGQGCERGYRLKDDLNIECGPDGCQTEECCTKKACTKRVNVPNSDYKVGQADMSDTSSVLGDSVTVTCDEGYKLNSTNFIDVSNLEWSDKQTTTAGSEGVIHGIFAFPNNKGSKVQSVFAHVPAKGEVHIQLRFWALDSWDEGQLATLEIDGTTVWSKARWKFNGDNKGCFHGWKNADMAADISDPWQSQREQRCYWDVDITHNVSRTAAPCPHDISTKCFKLTVGANIEQSHSTEAWAFSSLNIIDNEKQELVSSLNAICSWTGAFIGIPNDGCLPAICNTNLNVPLTDYSVECCEQSLNCCANRRDCCTASGTADLVGKTGDVVEVTCEKGYHIENEAETVIAGDVSCAVDGSFSTISCVPNVCTPSEVANSDKKTTGSLTGTVSDKFTVVCDTNFHVQGMTTRTGTIICGSDQKFLGIKCVADDKCNTIGVSVTCAESFHLKDNLDLYCGADGCSSSECCEANPILTCADTVGDGTNVAFSCLTGYEITSDPSPGGVICSAEACTSTECCVGSMCTPTEVEQSATYSVAGSLVGRTGDSFYIICPTGSHVEGTAMFGQPTLQELSAQTFPSTSKGASTITCQADGNFRPMFRCLPNQRCDDIDGDGTDFGQETGGLTRIIEWSLPMPNKYLHRVKQYGRYDKIESPSTEAKNLDILQFTWTGDHNVKQLPDQAAYDACDFSNAIDIGSTSPATVTMDNPATWTLSIQKQVLALVEGTTVTQSSQSGVGIIKTAVNGVETDTIVVEAACGQVFDDQSDVLIDAAGTLITLQQEHIRGVSGRCADTMFFACSKTGHCEGGQKIKITTKKRQDCLPGWTINSDLDVTCSNTICRHTDCCHTNTCTSGLNWANSDYRSEKTYTLTVSDSAVVSLNVNAGEKVTQGTNVGTLVTTLNSAGSGNPPGTPIIIQSVSTTTWVTDQDLMLGDGKSLMGHGDGVVETVVAHADIIEIVDNGLIDASTNLVGNTGDEILVSCDEGYTIGGGDKTQGVAVCGPDGAFVERGSYPAHMWKLRGSAAWHMSVNELADCTLSACPSILIPNSNYKEFPMTGNPGDTYAITCDEGYTTSDDVAWTAVCDEFGPSSYGTARGRSKNWGGVGTFGTNGIHTYASTPSGNPFTSTCFAKSCTENLIIPGQTHPAPFSSKKIGDEFVIYCNPGYALGIGGPTSVTVQCQLSLKLLFLNPDNTLQDESTIVTGCIKQKCSLDLLVPFSTHDSENPLDGFTGDEVTFTCDTGYCVQGRSPPASDGTQTCGSDGSFAGETCTRKKCVSSGIQVPFSNHTGVLADIRLPGDFRAKLSMCQGDCNSDADCAAGLFCNHRNNYESVPGCDGIGKSHWDYCIRYMYFEDSLTIKCDEGYTLDGTAGGSTEDHVVCQADQSYTSPLPVCQPIQCDTNINILHSDKASVDLTGVTGTTTNVVCDTGYHSISSLVTEAACFTTAIAHFGPKVTDTFAGMITVTEKSLPSGCFVWNGGGDQYKYENNYWRVYFNTEESSAIEALQYSNRIPVLTLSSSDTTLVARCAESGSFIEDSNTVASLAAPAVFVGGNHKNELALLPSTVHDKWQFVFGKGSGTLEAWVQPRLASSYYQPIISTDGSNTPGQFGIVIDPTGTQAWCQTQHAQACTGDWCYSLGSGADTLSLGTWHHVACTRDDSTGVLRIHVDGVMKGKETGHGGDVLNILASYPIIGYNRANTNEFFTGNIGSMRALKFNVYGDATFTPPVQSNMNNCGNDVDTCWFMTHRGVASALCVPNICTTNINVQYSNYAPGVANMVSSTGTSVEVDCNDGYVASSASAATCQADGSFTAVTCIPKACTTGLNIPNSDKANTPVSGVTGSTATVTCATDFYTGSVGTSTGVATCNANGEFRGVVCVPNPTCGKGEYLTDWDAVSVTDARTMYSNIFHEVDHNSETGSFVVGGSNSFVIPKGGMSNEIGVVYEATGGQNVLVGPHSGEKRQVDLRCQHSTELGTNKCGGQQGSNLYTITRGGQEFANIDLSCPPSTNHNGIGQLFDRGQFNNLATDFYEAACSNGYLEIKFKRPLLLSEIRLRPSSGISSNHYTNFRLQTVDLSTTTDRYIDQSCGTTGTSSAFVDVSSATLWPRGPDASYSTKRVTNNNIIKGTRTWSTKECPAGIWPFMTDTIRLSMEGHSPRSIIRFEEIEIYIDDKAVAQEFGAPRLLYLPVPTATDNLIVSNNDLPNGEDFPVGTWGEVQSLTLPNDATKRKWLIMSNYHVENRGDTSETYRVKMKMTCDAGCSNKFDGGGAQNGVNIRKCSTTSTTTCSGDSDCPTDETCLPGTPTYHAYTGTVRTLYKDIKRGSGMTSFSLGGSVAWLLETDGTNNDGNVKVYGVVADSTGGSPTAGQFKWMARPAHALRVGDESHRVTPILTTLSVFTSNGWAYTHQIDNIKVGQWLMVVHYRYEDLFKTQDSLVAECLDYSPRFGSLELGKCRRSNDIVEEGGFETLLLSQYSLLSDGTKRYDVNYGTSLDGQRQCMQECVVRNRDMTACKMWTDEHSSGCAVTTESSIVKGGGGDNADLKSMRCAVRLPERPCNENDRRAITSNIKSHADQSGNNNLEYGGSVSWLLDRKLPPFIVADGTTNLRYDPSTWRWNFKVRFQSHGRINGVVQVGKEKWKTPGYITTNGVKYRKAESIADDGCGDATNSGGCGYPDGYMLRVHDDALHSTADVPEVVQGQGTTTLPHGKYSTPTIHQAPPLPGLALLNYRFETKAIDVVFSCKAGTAADATCYSFYHGCTDCETDIFNHETYFPWSEREAQTYCMSWSMNVAASVGDVFAEEPCNGGEFRENSVSVYVRRGTKGSSSSFCTGCPAGFLRTETTHTNTACESCAAGATTQDQDGWMKSCTTCTTGKYATASMPTCESCPSGYISENIFSCREGSMTGDCYTFFQGCTHCNQDAFNDNTNSPWGETEARAYCMSLSINVAASAGDVFATGTCFADKDDITKTVGVYGLQACTACPAGWQADVQGTKCLICDVGKYQSQTGQSTCHMCSKGKFALTPGQSSCSQCLAGSYYDVLNLNCKECEAGSITATAGKAACDVCEPGKYHDEGTSGATTCKRCPVGTANHWPQVNGKKYHDSIDDCKICRSGTFADSTGAKWCKRCKTGKRMREDAEDRPFDRSNTNTTENHNQEDDCIPEEFTYVCKHRIHGGPGRTEQVSRFCGIQFEKLAVPWDGDYWQHQRNLPGIAGGAKTGGTTKEGYANRLSTSDGLYNVDPVQECSNRCRRAYPTTSSEPWTDEEGGKIYEFDVGETYVIASQYRYYYQKGWSKLLQYPKGTEVFQDGGRSGTLIYSLNDRVQRIFIRANIDSPPFTKDKGLQFTASCAYGSENYYDCKTEYGGRNSYPCDCYLPPTYNYEGNKRIINSVVTDSSFPPSNNVLPKANVGAMTARAFVISKLQYTISLSNTNLDIMENSAVTQLNGAKGRLKHSYSSGVSSLLVVADHDSPTAFQTNYNLILNGTTFSSSGEIKIHYSILASRITTVVADGGKCRCAEGPVSAGSKLSNDYWSYYYKTEGLAHPIVVGDLLELSLDEGRLNYIVPVLTSNDYYFTFSNPTNLCLRTLADWLMKRRKEVVGATASTSTQFMMPWNKWVEHAHVDRWGGWYERFPLNFERETFTNQFDTFLSSESTYYNTNYEQRLSIKDKNFGDCIEMGQYYTIKRLSGNPDVLYLKDNSINPKLYKSKRNSVREYF